MFPICKGDENRGYGIGHFAHIEPIWGIYSNHPLTDPNVYEDDVLVHGSDWQTGPKHLGYFRPFNSLPDGLKMEGNCKNAGSGFGKNEMYPCVYDKITYGNSITGIIDTENQTLPLSL